MTVNLTGDVMRDTQIFAQEAFRAMRDPDEDLLAVLLFWREAKLTHVEALDDAHFVDDAAKSNLFERVVTRLIRERSPEVVSLATPTRSGVGTASEDEVLVTVVGKTSVTMTRATVQRRIDAPPVLGAWRPFPDSPDFEVKSWINDALRSALVSAHSPRGLTRLFRRH